MKNLKCWRKIYNYGDKDSEGRKSVADGWQKKGNFTNPTLIPLVDIRQISQLSEKKVVLETYDIDKSRKYRENFDRRSDAIKRAIQIMKKHDKC